MGLGILGLEFQALVKIFERQSIFAHFIIGIAAIVVGCSIAGILFDMNQSYSGAFALFALTYTIASGLILYARPPLRRAESDSTSSK